MTKVSETASNVVRLSPFRAALERARRFGKVDALLAAPDARREIRRVPAEEVYWVVREAGIADARGLIALCTPDQIQRFLDLDVWRGDSVEPARFWPWVDAILAGGWERAARIAWGIDAETLGLLMLSAFEVVEAYDLAEPPRDARATADGWFYLLYKGPPEDEANAFKLVEALYADDHERARRFLTQVRSEIPSELEETARRFQSARREEMGFVSFDEAVGVYRKLRPDEAKKVEEKPRNHGVTEIGGEGKGGNKEEDGAKSRSGAAAGAEARRALPVVLVAPLSGESLLGQALDAVEDREEMERLVAELAFLANAVVSADRVDPDDKVRTAASFERVRDWVSIGLEVLAAAHGQSATEIVRTRMLRDLFAVGHAEVAKRAARARMLRGRGPWRLGDDEPFSLLVPPWSDTMSQLASVRPDGVRAVADAERLDHLLDEIGAMARIRDRLGISCEAILSIDLGHAAPSDRAALTIPMLIATAVAHRATSGAPALGPLPLTRLETLRKSDHLWMESARALLGPDAEFAVSLFGGLRDHLATLRANDAIDPRVASTWILLRV
ncbi:MAG: hypothetical protein HYY84_14085 [Deltaproteobacteria bacterium]|nr:hypothetical protein [Deltaproteobacteria bacterium]